MSSKFRPQCCLASLITQMQQIAKMSVTSSCIDTLYKVTFQLLPSRSEVSSPLPFNLSRSCDLLQSTESSRNDIGQIQNQAYKSPCMLPLCWNPTQMPYEQLHAHLLEDERIWSRTESAHLPQPQSQICERIQKRSAKTTCI